MNVSKVLCGVGSTACIALALAGCGSSEKKTASTPSTASEQAASSSTTKALNTPPVEAPAGKVISAKYTLKLSGANGVPPGAPGGSALATLLIKPYSEREGSICWGFSQLKNVPAPTWARIYNIAAGGAVAAAGGGIRLGVPYRASGCMAVGALIQRLIEAHSSDWFVAIDNARYPLGAVRSSFGAA
jgi:hypothetical protein